MFFPLPGGGLFSPLRAGGLDTSDGWFIAPPIFSFSSRRKRENGPCTVQKRKRRIAPAGGRKTGDAQGVPPFFTNVSFPRRSLSGGFGGCRKACPSLFAAADAPINGPVGAAALRPPLAALPLTAAAYPLRVLGGPLSRNLHVSHGPFLRAHPFIGRPFP